MQNIYLIHSRNTFRRRLFCFQVTDISFKACISFDQFHHQNSSGHSKSLSFGLRFVVLIRLRCFSEDCS